MFGRAWPISREVSDREFGHAVPHENLHYVVRVAQHGLVRARIGFGAHAHSKGAGID
jgi:hypothetical protein